MRQNAPVPLARSNVLLRELATLVAVVVGSAVIGLGLGIVLNHLFGTPKPSSSPRRAPLAQTTTGSATTSVVPSGTSSTGATTAATTTATGGTTTAATSSTTPTGTGAAGSATPVRTTLDLGNQVTLRVSQASLLAGTTAGAARLTVEATVQNAGTATATAPIDRLFIRYAGVTVRPDPNAAVAAGDLLKPIDPGKSASGELHFETRGAMAQAMKGLAQVAVRFGPQTLTVSLR